MKYYNPAFYVLTGGPGTGKTSLLAELERRGYLCKPEVARKIIREQMDSGGEALPWGNTQKYTKLMLERSIRDYVSVDGEVCFFDRGIPDTLAYARLIELKSEPEIRAVAEIYGYNRLVFLLPPWREIYRTDTERQQDYTEAVRTCRKIREVYVELGYQIVMVPEMSVWCRADFIQKMVKG